MKFEAVGNGIKTQSAILRHRMLSDYTTSTNLQTPSHASPLYTPPQVWDHAETNTCQEDQPLVSFFNTFYGAFNSWFIPCTDMNNNRYQCLRFSVGCNSVLHGFAGYFEATLYKDVTLSKSHVVAVFVAHTGSVLKAHFTMYSLCCSFTLAAWPDYSYLSNFWVTTLSIFRNNGHKLAWLSGERAFKNQCLINLITIKILFTWAG